MLQHVLNEKSEGLPLIFPTYELGFSYCYDNDSKGNMEFVPRLQVGSRMPHCNVTMVHSCERSRGLFPYLCIDENDERGVITLTDISQQLRNNATTSPYFACLFYSINSDNSDEMIQSIKNQIDTISNENNMKMNLVHILHPNDNMNHRIQNNYIPVIDSNHMFLDLLQKDYAAEIEKYHHVILVIRPDGHIMTVKFLSKDDYGSKSKGEMTFLIDSFEHSGSIGYSCQ